LGPNRDKQLLQGVAAKREKEAITLHGSTHDAPNSEKMLKKILGSCFVQPARSVPVL
jgi:hypothetical protein